MSVLVCVGVVLSRFVDRCCIVYAYLLSVLICVGVVEFRFVDVVLLMDYKCRCWFVSVLYSSVLLVLYC